MHQTKVKPGHNILCCFGFQAERTADDVHFVIFQLVVCFGDFDVLHESFSIVNMADLFAEHPIQYLRDEQAQWKGEEHEELG